MLERPGYIKIKLQKYEIYQKFRSNLSIIIANIFSNISILFGSITQDCDLSDLMLSPEQFYKYQKVEYKFDAHQYLLEKISLDYSIL